MSTTATNTSAGLSGLKATPPIPASTSPLKADPISYSAVAVVTNSGETTSSSGSTTITTTNTETKTIQATGVAQTTGVETGGTAKVTDTSGKIVVASSGKAQEISASKTDNSTMKSTNSSRSSSGAGFTRCDYHESAVNYTTASTSGSESGASAVSWRASPPTSPYAFRPKGNTKPAKKPFKKASDLKHGAAGDDKLVIGIDFGTTFTGIAYGLTSDPTTIKVIRGWPGKSIRGRNDILKIPTTIQYGEVKDDDSQSKGKKAKQADFNWGYLVRENKKGVIRGFKLGLDPSKRSFWAEAWGVPESDDMVHYHEEVASVEMGRLWRGTVEIVTDYIGAVYRHALAKITEAEVAEVVALPKQFVVTVPAIWSDSAKSATLRAVRLAHPHLAMVNPEDLVTEPEAAALYALQDFEKRGLKQGDTFVLCDAGGGTVDLISYQITSMRPRMQVKEVVSATGGAVGSMMINNGFERYLRRVLGDDVLDQMQSGDGSSFTKVMREFDQMIKPYFESADEWDDGGSEDDEGVDKIINLTGVNVKNDRANGVMENTITITGTVLEDIFNPLVTATEKLVRQQIEGVRSRTGFPPKHVILVGGFGASPYLKRRLEEMVEDEDVKVIRPDDAQAAIVKGAVLYKMPNTAAVTSSVAPTSLGVRAYVPYDPSKHEHASLSAAEVAKHAVLDPNEGVTRIQKMTWFILKGADLRRDEYVRFPCYRDLPADFGPENLRFEDELEQSDAALPPAFPWQGEGVRRKCVVTSDLGGIDHSLLVRRTGPNGALYYTVHYELVVAVRSAIMTFSVECQGRTFALVDVEF